MLVLIICGTLLSGCKVQKDTKKTNLPGPRYFAGRVSESEIYAGTIIALLGTSREDPPFSIVYLKRTVTGKRKHLPKYVEKLVSNPARPVIYQHNDNKAEKRWPVNIPIKRVANNRRIWPKGASEPINNGTYVELGSIKRVGDHVEIHGDNSFASLGGEYVDFKITLSKGLLKFTAVRIFMASSENRQLSSGNW